MPSVEALRLAQTQTRGMTRTEAIARLEIALTLLDGASGKLRAAFGQPTPPVAYFELATARQLLDEITAALIEVEQHREQAVAS